VADATEESLVASIDDLGDEYFVDHGQVIVIETLAYPASDERLTYRPDLSGQLLLRASRRTRMNTVQQQFP
jgi:hypothetical protein